MTHVPNVKVGAIFVLLPYICAHYFHILINLCLGHVFIDNWLNDRHLNATNHLVAKERQLMVIFPHKLLHVAIELLPCLIVRL